MRFTIPFLLTFLVLAGCTDSPESVKKTEAPETISPNPEPAQFETTNTESTDAESTESEPVETELTEAEKIAQTLLDDNVNEQQRRDLYPEHPEHAAEIVAAMAEGYPFGEEEEYRRIPWIWRVSINATKTLNEDEIRELLEVSLPEVGEPLADWQAVVIGGGVINGLTLKGEWPNEFLKPIIDRDTRLIKRWDHMLEKSIEMANDEAVRSGTRYDALRNIGLLPWEDAGAELTKYLTYNTESELKQGAVCGMADMHSAAADSLLLSGWLHYSDGVKFFALEGMLRTADRYRILKKEISAGRVDIGFLSTEQKESLLKHPHSLTQQHAADLFYEPPAVTRLPEISETESEVSEETLEMEVEAAPVDEAAETAEEAPNSADGGTTE